LKTDTIFYSLFQLFPELLFDLLGEDNTQASKYEFSSREIKELTRRFDGIMIPDSSDFTDLLYFVEVQFQANEEFYWRLFNEIFAYAGQYKPTNDWRAVAIFASQSLEPELPAFYGELRSKLRVVYLDEIARKNDLPLSLDIVKLVVTPEDQVQTEFPKLMEKLPQQITEPAQARRVLDFIETILLYKFTNSSREEIEAMFSLSDLRKTKVYQEGKAEGKAEGEVFGKVKGKLEAMQGLLALGLGVEQIAIALGLEVAIVERSAAGEIITPESLLVGKQDESNHP
jgi:predicted transposase/invertase (TIGR01784 family)